MTPPFWTLLNMVEGELQATWCASYGISKSIWMFSFVCRWNPLKRDDPYELIEDHGTSHMSVVDAEGNAVSITMTINTAFGSNG